jgi:hypothetical protein
MGPVARRLLAALAVLVAGFGPAGGASAQAPSLTDAPLRLAAAFPPPGFSGGHYTTSTGETVTVYSAPAYAADPAFNQRWADFVATMPHGGEISTVTIYFAPLDQVRSLCGGRALACYSPRDRVIFTTGDDVADRATAQSILAHEYGHHIANSRDNVPWSAEDYGTKRWASYQQVCSKSRNRELYPGDEGEHYTLNSGEGFAESYRVYVEQKLGLPSSPWVAVDGTLQPDATALALLGEDVATPWSGPTVSKRTAAFRPYTGDVRTFRFSTPLDGVLTLRLEAPAGAALDARLFDRSGGELLAQTTPGARPVKTVRYLVCGERSLELRVLRAKGFGQFTLQVSKP